MNKLLASPYSGTRDILFILGVALAVAVVGVFLWFLFSRREKGAPSKRQPTRPQDVPDSWDLEDDGE